MIKFNGTEWISVRQAASVYKRRRGGVGCSSRQIVKLIKQNRIRKGNLAPIMLDETRGRWLIPLGYTVDPLPKYKYK